MNETFCRALHQAGLTEEDLAALMAVDPKTVRRWLEGQALPYRRHRWTLASLLGTSETDLWPQLRSAQPRPAEVAAIYPHHDAVLAEIWLRRLESAEHDIDIHESAQLSLASGNGVVPALAARAHAGVAVRICLTDPDDQQVTARPDIGTPTAGIRSVLERYAPLRESAQVEIRLHRGILYSFIHHADAQLLVSHRAYGVAAAQAPVLLLQQTEGAGMFATYLSSFERTWAEAVPWTG